MSERIVAAAICQGGIVLTGPHHHQIIRYAAPLLRLRTVTGEQGFLTDRNRFVSRQEAAQLAFLAGQVDEWKGTLYSEQLWEVRDEVFIGGPSPAQPGGEK